MSTTHSPGPAYQEIQSPPPPQARSIPLHRSSWTLWVATIYSALSAFSWIIVVYISFHPITMSQIRYRTGYTDLYDRNPSDLDLTFAQNERWSRTARVLLSFAGVLSIPAASATCAGAAPVYSQRRANSRDLNLRKVIMLADRSWANPVSLVRALASSKGWSGYGSPFLIMAVLVHLLAFVVAPLQQIFLGTTLVKRTSGTEGMSDLVDIPSQLEQVGSYHPNNTVVLGTRDSLQAATLVEHQPQLWSRGRTDCETETLVYSECSPGIATFANIPDLSDPFLAELPSGYNTGLIRQYLPRINSSTTIVSAEFPGNCEAIPGSLFVHHRHKLSTSSDDSMYEYDIPWAVTICMPTDIREVPWKATRDRQDFSEELYVRIDTEFMDQYTVKITVNTTAGYFELPNYFNGGHPGPLLQQSPSPECGDGCTEQWSDYGRHMGGSYSGRDVAKGPLQLAVLALFGPDSFLTTWPLKANHTLGVPDTTDRDGYKYNTCFGLGPFGQLLDPGGYYDDGSACGFSSDDISVHKRIRNVLSKFKQTDTTNLENAFNAASFLANKAWMQRVAMSGHDLHVSYDTGKDTEVPTISLAGIVVVSAILAIYLGSLIALGIYATYPPRWTDQLDSFAMMRIGSALAPDVPLLAASDATSVNALDNLPGTMGDAAPEHEKLGRLWPGGTTPLRAVRRYYSYSNY